MKDLSSITLSYTYFPSKGGKPVAEADIIHQTHRSIRDVTSWAETS